MTSISRRLTLGFAAFVTLTTAIVLSLGGWLLSRQIVQGIDLLNDAEFSELQERLETLPSPVDPAEVSHRIRSHTEIDAAMYYFQADSDGVILFRSPNLGNLALPLPPDGAPKNWTTQLPSVGALRVSKFQCGALRIQIASPLAPTRRLLRDYVRVSAWLLGFTALASFALGHAFTRFGLKPLRLIRETAVRIRGDRLNERIPVSSSRDEINALATLLNQMFDRLEASFSQIQRFTADASHELKTPLTLIRLNAEKLRPALANDPAATTALEDLLLDISHLSQIIESLLFIAKAESGTLALPRVKKDTAEFLSSFAEDATALSDDRGIHFALGINPSGIASFDPNLVRQLLFNLVSNALNATPSDSTVALASTLTDDEWTLTIEDEGPGLPPDKLESIFQRFFRYHSDRSGRAMSGQGLGLAICKSIVAVHGGSIRAENRTDRSGLRLLVTLPR